MSRWSAFMTSLLALLAAGACGTSPQPGDERLAARCAELASLFEKYRIRYTIGWNGPSMARLSASIDCARGNYAEGIKALEDLLQRNRIPYPPASDGPT